MSRKPLTAATADKYALYETSVQTPDTEVDFIQKVFKRWRKRAPQSLREDFCGSAAFACEWVRNRPDRTSIGIDLDAKVLAWGKARHQAKLSEPDRKRVTLLQQNVLDKVPGKYDVCVAYNYSYSIFKTRQALLRYFKGVHRSLGKDGVFFLDLFGGSLSQQTSLEPRKQPGFTYIWEQAAYNPIDASIECHIHFRFKDGSQIERAFSYDWRLWTLVELQEILREAGFSDASVYWEDTDARGNLAGTFRPQKKVENDPAWNAYILGLK